MTEKDKYLLLMGFFILLAVIGIFSVHIFPLNLIPSFIGGYGFGANLSKYLKIKD